MKIAVCIKQVPILSEMQFDPESKSLKRAGVRSEVSAFDIRAVVKAVELKQLHGGEVLVVTMGPPQAREALLHCLALGADRALHLCDAALAGSDTLATARALAAALKHVAFDLILAGRTSVDAETGQVGPELAEMLDLPQITAAHSIAVDATARALSAERETDAGYETVVSPLPVLVTAAEDLAPERFPSKAERDAAAAKPIETVALRDLGLEPQAVGAAGSPTLVSGLCSVTTTRRAQIIESASVDEAAAKLAAILVEGHGLFGNWNVQEQPRLAAIADKPARSAQADVWVLAEETAGGLRQVTFELVGKALELASALRSAVRVLLIGHKVTRYADSIAAHGVDEMLVADDARLEPFQVETHADVLARAIAESHPGILLIPATSQGRDLAPRVAARLGLGLTGDCIDLGIDARGRLLQYKPAFGGSVVAPILSRTLPEMATVRPGMLSPAKPLATAHARIVGLDVGELRQSRARVIGLRRTAEAAADLDRAEIVVGIGKGIGGPENFAEARGLAALLGASLCTTRDVTDAGWLPRQHQVGLTGRAIAPKLYIAVAIRGAFEHMVGVRRAGLIVAINKNARAPIFKTADYGVVGDHAELVPALQRHLARLRDSTSDARRP
jgi:electron transfer flavoprotein alpha subunit